MFEKIEDILKRISSRHLAKLWLFYRNYFSSDELCMEFLHKTLICTPISDGTVYHQTENDKSCFVNDAGTIIYDSDFIPRRMLNAVVRLIEAARDMDQIRRGKDAYKITFIVTCIETLQQLSGKNGFKKSLLFSFFEDYTSEDDKAFITSNFVHDDEEGIQTDDDPFMQFVGVINEFRNCAMHEGEYGSFCFNNNNTGYPMLFVLDMDVKEFTKNKSEHCFRTMISYNAFEDIVVRNCIALIQHYTQKEQEEKEHADA